MVCKSNELKMDLLLMILFPSVFFFGHSQVQHTVTG